MHAFKKTESEIHPALTSFSDEEQMLREAVRNFRPRRSLRSYPRWINHRSWTLTSWCQ